MAKVKYKVRFFQDSTYEVIEIHSSEYGEDDDHNEKSVHQGSLADCEAYIRLHEGGYM